MKNERAKRAFSKELKAFASTLAGSIAQKDEWTIRGFIDVFRDVHPLSADTKLVSKVLELHLFPFLLSFGKRIGYEIEPADEQNYYPDLTFVSKKNGRVKFAVDLKTTYRDEKYPDFCNGFTLGSHGGYFTDRASKKNIQYPYGEYSGHFCLGVAYSRNIVDKLHDFKIYKVSAVHSIPSVIKNFLFFAEEKWKIASDKQGSGNTANIGSIQKIDDLVNGNGVFAKAGEELFDDYWVNFGKLEIPAGGGHKKLSSFDEYLSYRHLSPELNNPKPRKTRDR